MAKEGNLSSDKALKNEAVIRGFVFSILNYDDLLEDETKVIGSVLRQTEAELKNRLEQLRRLRSDTPLRVASALERDDNLASSSLHSKRARHRVAYPEGEVGICRHFCKDHPELMDITLWETLPAEVVERICAMLPLSKLFELLKLCEPWSRLPTATRFREICAKAHGDLFGIVMFSEKSMTCGIAMYDFKDEEWFHLELNMPSEYESICETLELVFGRDGGLMCVIPHCFKFLKKPPRIFVFNPLTGDKKYISVSGFTASIEKEEVYAVLLQLIMDAEPGCYKLILVTQRIKPGAGGVVYHSESYDSVIGLWSTLDSGFVYGDGVLGDKRYHVCFDCRLKRFCTPAEYGKCPHPHVYSTNIHRGYTIADPYDSFVRDRRFKLEFVDEMNYEAEILESVWLDGWNDKSIVKLETEMPLETYEVRLLACTRYVLVIAVADKEYYRQIMALYDRVTCEESVLFIPQFLREEFQDDNDFLYSNIQFMCDLNWDIVP